MKLNKMLLSSFVIAVTFVATFRQAHAQYAPAPLPPVDVSVDDNGVDLINKTRRSQAPTASIGADGLEVSFSDYIRKDEWVWTLNLSGSLFTVSMGNASEQFTSSFGNIVPSRPSGSKLEVGSAPNTYVYTSTDGDVITFDTTLVPSGLTLFPFPANRGVAVSMVKANGEHIAFKWTKTTTNFPPVEPGQPSRSTTEIFLKSVSSSKGYAIVYEGGVKAVNSAVDYCDLQTGTCPTITQNWPGFSRAGTFSTFTVTATDGRSITYNGLGDASTKTTTFANNAFETFSVSGNTATFTNGVGTWNYAWSTSGTTVTATITDPLSRTRTLTYNTTQKKILTDKNALNQTTSYQYDSVGRLERVTQPEGNYTHYTYDARGNIIVERVVAKPGSGLSDLVTVYTYDATCVNAKKCNKPNTVTDVAGKVTEYTYDANGMVTSVKSPAPSSGAVRPEVRYSYAPIATFAKESSGSLVQVGSIWMPSKVSTCRTLASCENTGDELVTEFSYAGSLHAEPTAITRRAGDNSLVSTTTLTYDVFGNVSSINGPQAGDGDKTVYFYDAMRRRIGSISGDPDGSGPLSPPAERISYDNVGRVSKVETGFASALTDAALSSMAVIAKTEPTYDVIGRVIKNQKTVYAQGNPGGKVVSVSQATYDSANQLTCAATRLNSGTFGSLPASACTHTSPGVSGYDRIASYTYDNLARVTNVRSADGTSDYSDTGSTYTTNGALKTLTDGRGNKTTYEYDGFDRQLKVRYPEAANGAVSSSSDYDGVSYDVYGRATTIRTRDNQSYTIAYDDLHRMVSTSLGDVISYNNFGQRTAISRGGQAVNWYHDAFGRIVAETTNGLTMWYQYNLDNQLKWIIWPDNFFVTYDYNDGGMPTYIKENGNTNLASYSYDNYGLTTLTRGNGATTSYERDTSLLLKKLTNDVAGTTYDNSFDLTYTESNQIKTRSLSNSAYEWNGSAATTAYVHNGLNQMTSAGGSNIGYDGRGNLNLNGWSSYGYDIHNRLTGLSSGASLSYDPAGRLWQTVTSSNATTRFLHSGAVVAAEYDAVNNLQRRYVHGVGIDEPLVWYEGNGTGDKRYLLTDERGSVVAVTNGAGNALVVNTYDEFGVPGSGNAGRFQYTGQMWLPEVGLYYYKARMYAPTLGRFMQADPIGYGDGMNMYAYVGNDPLNLSDPTGMYSTPGTIRNFDGDEEIETVTVVGSKCGGGKICLAADNVFFKGSFNFSAQDEEIEEVIVRGRKKPKVVHAGLSVDNFSWEKLAGCAIDQFGIKDVIALGAIAAGQPIPGSKPFVTQGSSKGTSLAGKASSAVFGNSRMPRRMPTLVGGPGTGVPLRVAYTRSAARFVGRAVPFVGWGILAYDAASIGMCALSR